MTSEHSDEPVKKVFVKRNVTTGKFAGRIEYEVSSAHDLSIDDFPPPGFNRNELTLAPPPRLAGVTSEQLEQSARRGGPSTQAAHIAEALEKKEE